MSRFLRALLLATCIYSFLMWIYTIARIIVSNIDPWELFISYIPIPFYIVGIISFVVSFICMVLYLYYWGFSRNP